VASRIKATHDDTSRGDRHRVEEGTKRNPGRLSDRGADKRHAAAKPAIADMIGHRHRAIADPRREELDQERRDWPVHHRDEDNEEVEHQDGQHHRILSESTQPRENRPIGDHRQGEAQVLMLRRPIWSESQPKKIKPSDPIVSATIMMV
jgi:hypothetical protein